MRKLLFMALLLMAGVAYGSGPKWTYPESPKLDDEINNIYHDIKAVPNGVYKTSSMTLQGITVDSTTVNYLATIKNLTVTGTMTGILGRTLQTVTYTNTNSATTTSATYASTGMTPQITPTVLGSTITISCTLPTRLTDGNSASFQCAGYRIKRGTTVIQTWGQASCVRTNVLTNSDVEFEIPLQVLDCPNSIAQQTYTIEFAQTAGAAGESTLLDNNAGVPNSTICLLSEIGL